MTEQPSGPVTAAHHAPTTTTLAAPYEQDTLTMPHPSMHPHPPRPAQHTLRAALGTALLWASMALAAACTLATPSAFAAPLLDIALARESDLDGLQGLGPATTQRILQERERQPFASWADLQRRVPGIHRKKSAQLSAQGLRIQGQPYPAAAP